MIADFTVTEPNSYTKTYRVTDTETGEVLFERTEEDPEKAFGNGRSVVCAYMQIQKEEKENGVEVVTFSHGESEFYRAAWSKPKPKTSRKWRRWSYFKEIASLPEEQQLAIIKILPFVKNNGLIVNDRGRALDAPAIRGLFFMGKNKTYRVWNGLIENMVLEEREKGWFITEKYCQR